MKTTSGKSRQSETKKVKTTETGSESGSAGELRDLFVNELRSIYWAEKALTKAIPKLVKNVTSTELSDALTSHLKETEAEVSRLEDLFSSISVKPVATKSEAMAGLILEAEAIMSATAKGEVRDAGIILAAQKIEHYEIAVYGTLCSFAKTLGEDAAATLLQDTLEEEKAADKKLSEIAESTVNVQAAEEVEA